MLKKALIVTGGSVDYDWAKNYIAAAEFDGVIAADSGLMHCKKLGIKVDYCLGDFDSFEGGVDGAIQEFGSDIKIYPCEKDDTDTWLAIRAAKELGYTSVVLLGATGSRLDHTMANVGNLFLAQEEGIEAVIIDKYNKIYPSKKENVFEKDKLFGKFITIIAFDGAVTGVSYEGFKYGANDITLKSGSSLGVSNELLSQKGRILIKKGKAIIFETKD